MADSMKAALKGQGGGLQGASTSVGNMMTEETQSGGQKRATAANESLHDMVDGSKKSGPTVGGTAVDATRQAANQENGSADHLGVAGK